MIMLLFGITSCQSTSPIVDNDDMYKQKSDTVIIKRVVRYYYPTENYYNPYLGWNWWGYPYQYYRPNTIIVVPRSQPQFKYEKRPDRDGNGGVGVPLNRRRGRN